MKKIIGSAALLFGLLSIIILFPRVNLNAGPRVIPKIDVPSTMPRVAESRKNVIIRALNIETRGPIANKGFNIYKHMLESSENYVSLSLVASGHTDENGELKVRLPKSYLLDATNEATLGGQVSSHLYFIRSGGREGSLGSPSSERYYEFDMSERMEPIIESDEERNYPETIITIWFPSPDVGTR